MSWEMFPYVSRERWSKGHMTNSTALTWAEGDDSLAGLLDNLASWYGSHLHRGTPQMASRVLAGRLGLEQGLVTSPYKSSSTITTADAQGCGSASTTT